MPFGERGPAHAFSVKHRARALKVSVVTYGELAVGFETGLALESFLHGIRVLSLPKHIAWEAGRIESELALRGLRLGENDNWLAATARAWGMPIVSRDKAFARVRGLRVIPY